MSGVSFPVTRPSGRALIVGAPSFRADAINLLRAQGHDVAEADDAYAAMLELCRHRLSYQSVIVCLASFYREELNFISTTKRRMPHVEIWLTQTDGRAATLVEAMRLGADGLLAEDGTLHRMPSGQTPAPMVASAGGTELLPDKEMIEPVTPSITGASSATKMESAFGTAELRSDEESINEPVLSADELRALLQDQPSMPPSGNAEER
jgi:hypothetical protein